MQKIFKIAKKKIEAIKETLQKKLVLEEKAEVTVCKFDFGMGIAIEVFGFLDKETSKVWFNARLSVNTVFCETYGCRAKVDKTWDFIHNGESYKVIVEIVKPNPTKNVRIGILKRQISNGERKLVGKYGKITSINNDICYYKKKLEEAEKAYSLVTFEIGLLTKRQEEAQQELNTLQTEVATELELAKNE